MRNTDPTTPQSDLRVTDVTEGRAALCREVLESLPAWFGRRAAREAYVAEADDLTTLAGFAADGTLVGVLTLKTRTSAATEIHVMGVKPDSHRLGVGRALMEAAALHAQSQGASVKTLAASHPDPHYASTRLFYEAMGFMPVEVFPDLWGEDTPCLLMARPLPALDTRDMTFIGDAERRLLQEETRASAEQVGALLAEDFVEVGRSGHVYDRPAMLEALSAEHRDGPLQNREANDLRVRPMGRDFAHVTYGATSGLPGSLRTHSFRSSIWERKEGRWRMIFHQGTAVSP